MIGRYVAEANRCGEVIRDVLQERGLPPLVSRLILVSSERSERASAAVWLFAVLDVAQMKRMEAYISKDILHQISTALHGRKVIISNSSGLRYAVRMTTPPRLAKDIPFPGFRPGAVRLGVAPGGLEIAPTWEDIGHMLVAGMTGHGKTQFLRLLVSQAIQAGHALILVDPDGRSFPYLSGHPALLAPLGDGIDRCGAAVDAVLAEIDRRQALYKTAPGFPDSLDAYNRVAPEPLRRLVVVIDEYNALISAQGGPRGDLSERIKRIAFMGRKFGVTLVLGGQEFSAESVGKVRGQMLTRICFRVENRSTSQIVVGRSGAEQLKTRGRAISSLGLFQAYHLGDPGDPPAAPEGSDITEAERALAARIIAERGGRMTLDALMQMGVREREARRMRDDWQRRGLASIQPEQDNALCVNTGRFGVQTSEPPKPSEPASEPPKPITALALYASEPSRPDVCTQTKEEQ